MAQIGAGTTFSTRALGGSGSFTKLAEVFDLPFPEFEHSDVEVTHYETEDMIEDFINGWATGQDMDIQLNYSDTAYAAALALQGTKVSAQIELPNGAKLVFDCNVKKVGGAIPLKDRITNTIKIKPTTKPVFTAAA